jgi:epoxyqueuosine reductase
MVAAVPMACRLSSSAVKQQAQSLGFDLVGVAPASAFPELNRLKDWLSRGYAGEMVYLHKSAETRADIRHYLPTARSVIVTATVYYTDDSAAGPGAATAHGRRARIARYAWGEDYHLVLAERLARLVAWMREESPEAFDARVFVDKHHVQERVFAKHAGLGWIGKNTCLISPEVGSWVFLAGVAVSLELLPDAPQADRCGSCTLCIDACPTGALVDEYELDATRCISYLTIEHKGAIPEAQRAGIDDHVFGCDICQEVCPYNLAPLATLDPAWQPEPRRVGASAVDLWLRSDEELHQTIAGSAMTRTSLSRLRRNLAVVLGNSAEPRAAEVLDRPGGGMRRAAQSAETPLVQEHVEWAKMVLRHPDH